MPLAASFHKFHDSLGALIFTKDNVFLAAVAKELAVRSAVHLEAHPRAVHFDPEFRPFARQEVYI